MVLSTEERAVLRGLQRHGRWVSAKWIRVCHPGIEFDALWCALAALELKGLVEERGELWRAK